MAVIKIPTNFNIDLEFEVPEFFRRILALVIDTVQSRVYVANFGSDSLAALALSTLAPIAGSPYAVGHSPGSLAFSATVNRLYVGCYGSNPGGIHLFNPSTAPMTQVAGSPFYSGSQFVRLVVGP